MSRARRKETCSHLAQRIARAFALDRGDELFRLRVKASECGVGELAVHFDVGFAREGEGVARPGGPGVAEQSAEDVGDEFWEERGFLEGVRSAGGDEFGPVLQPVLRVLNRVRQNEGVQVLADDRRVKKGFGFDGHDLREGLGDESREGGLEFSRGHELRLADG